jgi:hypothetical protein
VRGFASLAASCASGGMRIFQSSDRRRRRGWLVSSEIRSAASVTSTVNVLENPIRFERSSSWVTSFWPG